ncbi:EAL domain-containing protein [Oxalobacteraceae bacterium R-40]|uniref:EAL domain-containing protein n=1 Tax=Keguizhuia sedimenti TaxID=3064264 RepID=A0ABU1BV08_9BURK|nr:EAL domain-containing protein [Oxalobacteraceae bacterium R-40]
MTTSSTPDKMRLDAQYASDMLNSPVEPVFDELALFAASFCATPIALISLIGKSQHWYKASAGLTESDQPLANFFCDQTIARKRPFVVEDAIRHPEFLHKLKKGGVPGIRFFAGLPLITEDGIAIGVLSVMDRKPRKLSQSKLDSLAILARHAMTTIELRHQRSELQRALSSREEVYHQLHWQSRHFRESQRIAKLGSWEMDLVSWRLQLSDEVYRIFGVEHMSPTVSFDNYLQSVHREDHARVIQAVTQAIAGQSPLDLIHRIVRKNKEIRFVHERGQLMAIEDGQVLLAGTVQDITDSYHSQRERDLLYTSISKVNDSVMITEAWPIDEPGPRIVFVNRAFEERTGYDHSEVIGRSPRFLQGIQTQRDQLDRIRAALENHQPVSAEIINYTREGKPFWIEMDIAPVAIQGNDVTHFVSVQRDITQRKAAEGQIERLAFFDPLTKLPNRRLLMDRLEHAIETARRKRNCGALLFIDLDNFKSLNDTLGHDKGDLLLAQVARRLENSARKSNTVARLGGDEFVILLEDLAVDPIEAAAEAEIVGEKILAGFVPPFNLGNYEHHCTPSIGVTLFDTKALGADDLMKRADLAMYQAKSDGRNAIRFFDKRMQSQINTRVMLDREFRRALKEGQFVLHYQRQVDDMGKVTGIEALVRWQHPRRGMLYPSDFIWLAEENGLIMHLGRWVLQCVCNQVAEWLQHGDMVVPPVAINVSARQFHHHDFLPNTLEILEKSGIDPQHIKLELTESALVEHMDATVAKMSELRAHGIRFSLDDFGTGYSSLAYLKKLPLDEIKIDRAFVRDILTDPGDAAITQTIVSLCQILGFDVVAEGVENEGQQAMLALQGCRHYQGYWFGRPVPAGQL